MEEYRAEERRARKQDVQNRTQTVENYRNDPESEVGSV
jgi:hypothetical protein